MYFPEKFLRATDEMCTYEKHVNAPYIRKSFSAPAFEKAYITITGLGFYKLYINGNDITKGLLAPYISNPDDIVYYDKYDVTELLKENNSVGLILGNGMQNCNGGRVWDFDIARFRNVPCFAMSVTYIDKSGNETVIDADESFKCHPSPIIFDDLRSGCFYDANLEISNWLSADFDDSAWQSVKSAETPRGERRLCEADPILVSEEIKAIEIKKATLCNVFDNRENMRLDTQFKFNYRGQIGVVFDFGVNAAGIFKLKVDGVKGQEIYIQFCEFANSKGEPSFQSTGSFYPEGYGQTAYYICKGEKDETFIPDFTYIGYRYAVVFGLNENQISKDTITMLVASSSFGDRGSFDCSDKIMNALRDMGKVSDRANFYYFPTDCPHREKNGWTGDAAVSCEHMMLTMKPEKSYREWLRNICASQTLDGKLPGIVPTGGWGFAWGNGPAWDNVLTELCWQIFRFTGDLKPAQECADSMLRYLSYISRVRRKDGLVEVGLGDWLQPGRDAGAPTAPLYLTDSVISMYIAKKSSDLFGALNLIPHKEFADKLYNELRESIRKNLINFSTMTVASNCQTAQAICIYYNVFNDAEKPKACEVLIKLVHEKDDHFDCGMIGIRTIFHVLSECGESELAYKMITRNDYPSYGMFVKRGYTSLAEDFFSDEFVDYPNSLNHHFMGDITSWFIQKVVGIRPNEDLSGTNHIDVKPNFISQLDNAKADYESPYGKVSVSWERKDNGISLDINCPNEIVGYISLPFGYIFVDENDKNSSLHHSSLTKIKEGKFTVICP